MQVYSAAFARAYDLHWGDFARKLAPRLLQLYQSSPLYPTQRTLLDVCCGAGHLAAFFLDAGFQVTGIDLSPAMLALARQKAVAYLESGRARFIVADAADFSLDEPVGIAVATYDALNHLPDLDALRRCFACVARTVLPGGLFVFDLNTRQGLERWWNGMSFDENEELTLLTRGLLDVEGGRALTRITGFIREAGGTYTRFTETVANTIFAMQEVYAALLSGGWSSAHFAADQVFTEPIANPEEVDRVYIVAQR